MAVPPTPNQSITNERQCLIPVSRCIFAAFRVDSALIRFAHVKRYLHSNLQLDASIIEIVACMGYADFDLEEAAANTTLLIRSCDSGYCFDHGTTLGLFSRHYYNDSSSFIPLGIDFQASSSGDFQLPSPTLNAIDLSSF
ncbi:hypothetical protein B9Z19DRAFT_1066838 [Tuber borchii]|uniref:Uncharacterized protein n=1 Tax=Tuber borchii TaxID=42251 RepID=A0A2T6ZL62_TUBBO|nr:hypothetical protein B9Z19DRAFT_1066838 [Tuber borchii]